MLNPCDAPDDSKIKICLPRLVIQSTKNYAKSSRQVQEFRYFLSNVSLSAWVFNVRGTKT